MDSRPEEATSRKKNPWQKLPTWGKWVVGVVAALLLLGVGGAIGASGTEEGKLKSELASTQATLRDEEEEREGAEKEAEQVMERRSQIISNAKGTANRIVGNAKSQRSTLESRLEEQRAERQTVEQELSETEASLSGAEEEKALSSIPGDGTFKAEVDFLPGTYRSSGGEGCYWATLNSADPYDIASNENATGPTIASIHTPYFQTSRCGEWHRIGE